MCYGWENAINNFEDLAVLTVHSPIENVGNGVGFLEGYAIAHEICETGKEPTAPLISRGDLGRIPIRSDAYWQTKTGFHAFQTNASERLELIEFIRTLYVYGYLRYRDLGGNRWRSGFIYEYIPDKDSPSKGVFAIHPSPRWGDTEEERQRQRRFYEFWRPKTA